MGNPLPDRFIGFLGGQEAQERLLEQEGHEVGRKGKNFFIEDFRKRLLWAE
jgi:hypothetical protein